MVQKITNNELITLIPTCLVLDVRSPGEYEHAHIPNSVNLPLFTNEERAIIGTAYKQRSKEEAIKIGLDYFGKRMKDMVEQTEKLTKLFYGKNFTKENKNLVIHCWRGGMRSAAVAWLMDLYGFQVCQLEGGYKTYRKWVLQQFEKQFPIKIIGGYTGSGKTEVLHELAATKQKTIDLEALGNHKGSAFGEMGPQPSQEMFENKLAYTLFNINNNLSINEYIYIEDESQRIGLINIPVPLWQQMRSAPIFFLEIPFEERLDYIVSEYGKLSKEKLINAIIRIQQRLGGLETKNSISFLLENNIKECFRILLKYYDKYYIMGLNKRPKLDELLTVVVCDKVNKEENCIKLLELESKEK